MRRRLTQLLWVCIALCSEGSVFAQEPEVVGWVADASAGCTVRPLTGQPEAAVRGRALYARDQIQCADGSEISLQIGCSPAPILVHGHHDPITLSAKSKGLCDKRVADVLTRLGASAGRERSVGNLLYSPLDQYPVTPGTLVLRWQRLPGRTLHFELRQRRINNAGERSDDILWRSGDVDGWLGTLTSPELREALSRVAFAADDTPLMLWMFGTGSSDQVARFRLLSNDAERKLTAELNSLEQLPHDPFLQHVARADVYKRSLLFPEAAQEYEAALIIAPDNSLLRERAREMYQAMGDSTRAKEL